MQEIRKTKHHVLDLPAAVFLQKEYLTDVDGKNGKSGGDAIIRARLEECLCRCSLDEGGIAVIYRS